MIQANLRPSVPEMPLLQVEQAVVAKGGSSSTAPLILLHPPQSLSSPLLASFQRPAGLLFQYMVGRFVVSRRYSSVVVLGLEEDPRVIAAPSITPNSNGDLSTGSSKLVAIDGFSDPLRLSDGEGKKGQAMLSSPEMLLEVLQSSLPTDTTTTATPGCDGPPTSTSQGIALMVDSLFPLLDILGLRGTLRWFDLIREHLTTMAPIVSVLWPSGLPPSVALALEDRATTNIYLEPCTRHGPSRILPLHGKCRVIRKSSSGRVQEGEDYYQVSRGGKMTLHEGSCCTLDATTSGATGDRDQEEESSSKFLEDLAAQLKMKGDGEAPGPSVTMVGDKPQPALMFMEEDDPEFDDEDEDDGLDDDLDL